MKALRLSGVMFALVALLAACGIIAPESAAEVRYNGEVPTTPFLLPAAAGEVEFSLVNTGEMQFSFTVSTSDNAGNWLRISGTQGSHKLDPEESYPVALAYSCDVPGTYEATIVVEYTNVNRANSVIRIPVVLECASHPTAPEPADPATTVDVKFDGAQLINGNTVTLTAGGAGQDISIHNTGDASVQVEISLPDNPAWLQLNHPIRGPQRIGSGDSIQIPLSYACVIGGTLPTDLLVEVDGKTHMVVEFSLTGCDVPGASLAFEIDGSPVTEARFTPMNYQVAIDVVNTSTTTPLEITSTIDDDNGVFTVVGVGLTTLQPGASQSLTVSSACGSSARDGAGFVHVEYNSSEPPLSLPILLTGCMDSADRLVVSRADGGIVGGTIAFDASRSSSEALSFTNVSEQPVEFSVSTDSSDWLSVDAATGTQYTVLPGEKKIVTASFVCPATGSIMPDEIFIDFPGDSPRVIPVSLVGCQAPESDREEVTVTIDGRQLGSSNQITFAPGASQQLEITNSGNVDLEIEFSIDESWLAIGGVISGKQPLPVDSQVVATLQATCPTGAPNDATVQIRHGSENLFAFQAMLAGCLDPADRLAILVGGAKITSALELQATSAAVQSQEMLLENISAQSVDVSIETPASAWFWSSEIPGASRTIHPGEAVPVMLYYHCTTGNPPADDLKIMFTESPGVSRDIAMALNGCDSPQLELRSLDGQQVHDVNNISLPSTSARAVLSLHNPSATTPLEFTGEITSGSSQWLHAPALPSSTPRVIQAGESFDLPLLYTCPSTGTHTATIDLTDAAGTHSATVVLNCSINDAPLYVSAHPGSMLDALPLTASSGENTTVVTVHNPSDSGAEVTFHLDGVVNNWLRFESITTGTSQFNIGSGSNLDVTLAYSCVHTNTAADYAGAEFVVKNAGVEHVRTPVSLTGCDVNPAEQVTLFVGDIEATAIRLTDQDPQNLTFGFQNSGSEPVEFTLDITWRDPATTPYWIEITSPYAGRITAQPGQQVPFAFVYECTGVAGSHYATLRVNIIGGIVQDFPIELTGCQ